MRFFNRFLPFFVIVFILTIQGCKKDESETGADTSKFNNQEKVTATIFGTVVDEQGNIVSGANVTLSGHATTTDQNGFFYFSNISTSKRASVVVVSKAGYFNGSRTMFIQANGKHSTKITLMSKGTPQTFSAASGGMVVFDGLRISFSANSIVNKVTGVPYSGTVDVYAHKIDPTTALGLATMPGDLRGLATAGNENVLQSFGMFVAELYDENGNALQIAGGAEATITTDIPASLQGTAPSNIPLWYFDETIGVWVEDGQAVMQNGKYVGNVSHFTYWNCDGCSPCVVDCQLILVDQNGTPLRMYQVVLTNTTDSMNYREGLTNNNGWTGGLFPCNTTLRMDLYEAINCVQTPIYSQTITTGNSNQDFGTIVVTTHTQGTTIINSSVQDCNGNPLTEGAVYVSPLGITVAPDANGNISYVMQCVPPSVSLIAYDFTANINGSSGETPLTLNVVNSIPITMECGQTSTGGGQSNITQFTLTNSTTSQSQFYSTQTASSAIVNDSSVINISYTTANSLTSTLVISAAGTAIGTYSVQAILSSSDASFPDTGFTFIASGSSATFTANAGNGTGSTTGNFTLIFIGSTTGNTYTATGNFHLFH